MLLIAILVSITGLGYGTSILNISLSNCSSNAIGSILQLQTIPSVPELNQAFTFRSYVYANEAIGMKGTYQLTDPDVKMAGSVCEGNSTSGKWGKMTYIAAACPIPSGNFNLSMTVYFSSDTVPYIDRGEFVMYDGNGREVFCAQLSWRVH